MVPEAFDKKGQTSPFSYKKRPGPGDASASIPVNGTYYGHFLLKQMGSSPLKVEETDVTLEFKSDPMSQGIFSVTGEGSNRFGAFDLKGSFDKNTAELRVSKLYKMRKVLAPPPVDQSVAASTGGLTQDEILSAALTPRNRSERKRKTPNHLQGADGEMMLPTAHLQRCETILKQLAQQQFAAPFLEPVDPVILKLPDYFSIVKHPMDLGTVRRNLESQRYKSPDEFAAHVRLTFRNAMTYNTTTHPVHIWAKDLSNVFERKYAEMMAKLGPAGAASAVSYRDDGYSGKQGGGKQPRGGKKPRGRQGGGGGGGGGGYQPQPKYPRHQAAGANMQSQQQISDLQSQLADMKQKMDSLMSGMAAGSTQMPQMAQMGFEEKRSLSLAINKLPGEKLNRVLQIISERMPLGSQNGDEEIEIDLAKLDTPTLRHLQEYVKVCVLLLLYCYWICVAHECILICTECLAEQST
jgi:hypothetical protein